MTVTATRAPSWKARAIKWWMSPCKSFDKTPPPIAPDYTDHGPCSWAAFPGRTENPAELRPEGEEGEGQERLSEDRRRVDCFFLYPTTFGILSGGAYNAVSAWGVGGTVGARPARRPSWLGL